MNATGSKDYDKRIRLAALIFCTIFFSFLVSCKHQFKSDRARKIVATNPSAQDFSDELQTILKPVDTMNRKKISSIQDNVRYAYQLNEYLPFWISDNKPNKEVTDFFRDLEELKWDGLDPERYHLSALKQLSDKLSADKHNSTESLIALDTALTSSYIAAAHDLLIGTIVPASADSLWFYKNDSICRAPELLVSTDGYLSLDTFRSKVPTYRLLREQYKAYVALEKDGAFINAQAQIKGLQNAAKLDSAAWAAISVIVKGELPWFSVEAANDSMKPQAQILSTYQFYSGLRQTAKPDSATLAYLATSPQELSNTLKANMERVRWMERAFTNIYVIVDVPLMELFFRKDGENVMHMRVVVGKPIRQTPSLIANMTNVIINPPWGVPPTILKKDVLPGITKSGKKYLEDKGLQAYDHKGRKVNNALITVKNYSRYIYKQDPGDDNSLGYVKFNLPNPWDIYLHDTPHRGDFVKRYRALSSGCIRLQEPKEMALYILSELEKKRFDSARLDSMIQTHKTRWETLKNKIPVHIVYLTDFEDSTGMHIRRVSDIYGRDEKLISMLK